ncbi:MAG: MBL fold metallo-hydrolase [Rhodanobacter sp.]
MRSISYVFAVIFLTLSFPALAATPRVVDMPQQAPPFYRATLGEFNVTVLSDGVVTVPFDKLLRGISPARIDEAFSVVGEHAQRRTSINSFLIETAEHLVLIDAGAGEQFGACCGRLAQTLVAAGYRPEDVDIVLLTHVHGDHSSGLTKDGRRVFPHADIYLAKDELDFWMSDTAETHAKASDKPMFAEGRAALAPYQAAGRIHTFERSGHLFEGVTAIAARGHTPGHTFYEIASKGHHMLVTGDLIHAAEIQFADPSVTIDFDIYPSRAAATRKTALDSFARSHQLVAAEHISFPGLGHVSTEGGGYRWVALPYAGDVVELDP